MAATAAALSVSERTVRRRLEAIEQRIGRQLYGSEIELALRLEELIRAGRDSTTRG